MTITFSDHDEEAVQVLTLHEVAEQLTWCGAIHLEADEEIGECRLECGCDLEIDINCKVEDDVRCSGYNRYTETFSLSDIRDYFTQFEYYKWATKDGEDILLCLD